MVHRTIHSVYYYTPSPNNNDSAILKFQIPGLRQSHDKTWVKRTPGEQIQLLHSYYEYK